MILLSVVMNLIKTKKIVADLADAGCSEGQREVDDGHIVVLSATLNIHSSATVVIRWKQ